MPLLLTGLVGTTVSLAAVGGSFAALENQPEGAASTTVGGIVTVLALVVLIASSTFSMGPIVWRLVPETKDRSLEEIQERWVIGGDRMLEEEAA